MAETKLTEMDVLWIQVATFGLPILALLLIAVWVWWQWSVISRSLERFRLQSDESDKLHLLNSFALGVLSVILFILFVVVLAAIGKTGTSVLLLNWKDLESLRWLGLAFVGLLTVLAGILSAPLALIRVNATERQTRATQEQVEIKRREYTTNLINQATEHLGASLGRDSAKPNIPLRIGGLLALERIAQYNIKDYHVQIMDMICTYIRENAPYTKPDADESLPIKSPVRMDIQFAVDILARRTEAQIDEEFQRENYHLDLDHANLTDVDFVRSKRKADFSYASFRECSLVRARFEGANLRGAHLVKADLREAFLVRADLTGANMIKADMAKANLAWVNLTDVYLMEADLTGANLREAFSIEHSYSEAELMEAEARGMDLPETSFSEAKLTGACLEGADLAEVNFMHTNLTEANLMESDLRGVHLEGAKVTGAKFDNAKMRGTKPKKSVILEYVEKDESLPSRFRRPPTDSS